MFKPIRKTQRQCKTMMADLEINHRKSSEKNQSLPTTLETEKRIISDKNAIAEELITFF